MTTQNTDPNAGGTTPAGTQAAPAAGAEPPKSTKAPPAGAQPPAKADPPAAAAGAQQTPAADGKPAAPPPPKTLSAEDDEIPENEELFQLSKKALNARLGRHTKRELKERFGTDDPDEIKLKLDKLAVFESEAETRRQADLTESQRQKERADKAEADLAAARADLQRQVDAQTFAEFDGGAKAAIAKYFDEDADTIEFATDRLKRHILALDDSDLQKPADVFDAWAKEYVEKHPKYAKKQAEPPKQEPKTIALDTGAKVQRPEQGDPKLTSKTARPGQANTMSKAEYSAFKRQHGLA